MSQIQWLSQLQLCSQPLSHRANILTIKKVPCAVLVLLQADGNYTDFKNISVVLTKRSLHLKHHAGQICFPGGKYDEQDHTLKNTALRETAEEIGINEKDIDILCTLPSYQTLTNYHITPYVGLIKNRREFTLNTNEVSEIFSITLAELMILPKYEVDVIHQNKPHTVRFIPYKNYNIWGATAAILDDLKEIIK